MSGWVIKQALLGGQDFVKQGIKKNLEPVRRLVANLESIRQDLDNGVSIREAGHQLRPEKKDVFRIGQGDRKLKESRLYVYFYIEGKNIVLLNIGTKDRQSGRHRESN